MTYISGKYDSARDEILDIMVMEGWGNKSGGDVESPSNHFALITIAPEDETSIWDAFSSDFVGAQVGFTDVIGSFVLETNSQGFVTVHDFETETAAEIVYSEFEREYSHWLINNDSHSLDGQCAGCESFDHTWNTCPNN